MGTGTQFDTNGTAAARKRPSALAMRIAAIAIVLDAFVLVLAGLSIDGSRRQYYARAEIMSRNMAAILAETVAGYFDRIDFALRVVVDAAEHEASGAVNARGYLDEALRKAKDRVPEAETFGIADGAGNIRGDSGHSGRSAVTVADRNYFRVLRDMPRSEVTISRPLHGRLSDKWTLVLARRVSAVNGAFGGIAFASLPIEEISDLFAHVDLRPDDAIALRGPLPDLGAIARYPETVGGVPAVGNSSVSPQLQAATATQPDKGTYVAHAAIDGIERVLSYHRVGAYPYYLVVGLSTAQMMRQWWDESVKVVVLSAAFVAMTTLGGVFTYVSLRARQALGAALQRKNEELARFAEILAHHMQEPVRQQHIFAQHLARLLPRPLSTEVEQALDAILEAARRHRILLRDAQSYLAVDGRSLSIKPVSGDAALDAALARLGRRIAAAGAVVERSPLPDLPIATPALAEVLGALVENAITYCAPGVQPHVRIAAEKHDGETVVSVTDNGIGIPPEFRDRVFGVFERLDLRPDQPGTGIGLALAKKIIESVGGRIWIEAPDSGGTRLCFTLPRPT